MTSQKHIPYQSLLNTMRDEEHSLRAEITKLSVSQNPRTIGGQILLLLDYLQIISSVLFFSENFETNQESALLSTVRYIYQLANPASWIRFNEIDFVEIAILCLIGLFSILKYLLFGYIILVAGLKVKPLRPLIETWRVIFRVQIRFLYFVTSSLWMGAISAFQNSRNEWTASQYYGVISISYFMASLEFLFSLYLNIYHFDILPSRKFLSAKDNVIETLNLVQKLILQPLTVALDLSKLSNMWIFTLINLIGGILKDYHHFGTLPFYSFKALSLQAVFLMITTCLNISCLIECLAKSIDDTSGTFSRLIATWTLLSILSAKYALGYISERFWNIASSPLINSPSLLIHRMFVIKQIRKMATPLSEHQDKNSLALLVLKAVSLRARDLLKLDSEFQAGEFFDLNNPDLYDKVFEHYLRKLNKLFPRNKFIQLCTAQFQIQKLSAIRDPTEILHKLIKSSDLRISLSAELLLMEIQALLRNKYQNPTSDESLDLRKFIHENILFAEVKQKVIEQADLQIRICNQVKKESPDLAEIFENSQKLAIVRQKTIKSVQNLLSNISDSHLSPLLFCARYHLILNYSLHENLHYLKIYNQKLQKYQKFFQDDKLVRENMFGHDVGFMLFSNNESTVGKAIYVSKAFAKRVGQDNDSLMMMNLLKNAPPCLYESRIQFFKHIAEHGEKVIPDKITRGFAYNKLGFLVELDFYVNIHPFLSSDFCLSCIERAVISNREYIYVLENGEIDCTTQGISQKLGLKPNLSGLPPGTNFTLSDISQELVLANEAFNMIFFDEHPEIKPKIAKKETVEYLHLKEAREIYTSFAIYGQDISLNSVTYRCTIVNQYLGKSLLKLITLEEKSRKFQTEDLNTPHENTRRHYQAELEELNIKNDESNETASVCDERNWAEMDTVISPQISLADYKTPGRFSVFGTPRGNLLGLMTSSRERDNNFKSSPEDSKEEKNKTMTLHHIQRYSESTGGRNLIQQNRSKGFQGFAPTAASVDTSKLSKLSHQRRVISLYKTSLNTKYTPKIGRIFIYLLLTSFLFVLASQIVIKSMLDDNVEDLSVKKDILRCALLRNYQLVKIESSTRILWDLSSGTLSTAALGDFGYSFQAYPAFIEESLTALNSLNNQLLLNMSSLDKEMYPAFFTKDVRVYENYFDETPDKYDDFDNFQATNRIIETASSIFTSQGMKNSTTENSVYFITRNSLNGLLKKNQEISQVLVTSLDNQRDRIRRIVKDYWIVLITLLSLIIVAFLTYSWKQHLKQVINLSAFCRVNPTRLIDVSENCLRFKICAENDDFQDAEFVLTPKQPSTAHQNSTHRGYKNPNSVALGKKNLIFVGKFVSLMLAMMALIGVSSSTRNRHLKTTKDLQAGIYSLDYYQSLISLASVLFLELTATNNVALVENIPVLERLEEIIDETYKMKRSLYMNLMETQNYLENSENFLETLAGEEACETIELNYYKALCLTMKSRGYQPGLTLLLTSFNSRLKRQVAQYKDSNKTEAALIALKNEDFETTFLLSMVITYQLDRLGTIVDNAFEEKIEKARLQRITITTVFVSVVIVLGFLLWMFVLSRLKESLNQFKNVLAVVPADLVLGSFMLRTFLIKTSHGALDMVKNELN